MGQSQSFTSYEDQLLNEKRERAYKVPKSAEKGASEIIRSLKAKRGFVGFLKETEEKREVDMDTAWKLFNVAVKKYGNNDFIGFRPWTDVKDPSKRGDYKWMTYKRVYENYIMPWGNGLQTLGLPQKTNIGIFSINRPEWYCVHMGNLSQSYRTVALYDTLGATAVAYITSHAECQLIVCEKNKLKNMFQAVKDIQSGKDDEKNDHYETYKNFALKYVVQFDYDKVYGNKHETVDDEDKVAAKELGLKLIGFSEIIKRGKGKTDCIEPKPEDLAYIMYTSGTTGDPKGVMLSHSAFAAVVASGSRRFGNGPDDVYISYLPLAHIFEATGQSLMTSKGAKVAYFQGDIRKISEDWKAIRPTFLVGVPRVYSKIYDKFESKKAKMTGLRGALVHSAQESSISSIRQGKRSLLYDYFVWSKVPAEMGFDRVRILVSGAAPLPPHVAEFFRVILPTAKIFQGYGMTETCAGGTITDDDDYCVDHVGVPVDNVEVRLIDAPECGYLTTDKPNPHGEIQFRGISLMTGYFKNEKTTNKTLSKDGWLSTGDIGRINPNNTISIIDRRKNLLTLSSGENIAAEKIEAQYTKVPSVAQCFVYANSQKSFLVGIIVPQAEYLMDYFHKQKWATDADLTIDWGTEKYPRKWNKIAKAHKADIRRFIKGQVEEWKKGGESGLLTYEFMKDFEVECEINSWLQGFSVDNDCLTPTFKKKRPQLTKRYMDTIKQMYTDNGEPPKEWEHW